MIAKRDWRTEPKKLKVRLVLMSDTHGHHREIDVPDGDVLLHAGDFTMLNKTTTFSIRDFNDWLGDLPHKDKVLIPGNHDAGFIYPEYRELITNARLLINEGIEVQGLKIWGSPITPNDWGTFGAATAQERARAFSRIPDDTDVLITHGPPLGILDQVFKPSVPQGCLQLLDAVRRARPRYHVFGHIHQGYGRMRIHGTEFINAALAGPSDALAKSPIVIDIVPALAHAPLQRQEA